MVSNEVSINFNDHRFRTSKLEANRVFHKASKLSKGLADKLGFGEIKTMISNHRLRQLVVPGTRRLNLLQGESVLQSQ